MARYASQQAFPGKPLVLGGQSPVLATGLPTAMRHAQAHPNPVTQPAPPPAVGATDEAVQGQLQQAIAKAAQSLAKHADAPPPQDPSQAPPPSGGDPSQQGGDPAQQAPPGASMPPSGPAVPQTLPGPLEAAYSTQMPPTPPMLDPPAQPLPVNPRPNPQRPWDQLDQARQLMITALLESHNTPRSPLAKQALVDTSRTLLKAPLGSDTYSMGHGVSLPAGKRWKDSTAWLPGSSQAPQAQAVGIMPASWKGAAESPYSAAPWKHASQDNSQPRTSATGLSRGLKFQHKPDQYLRDQDAWASVGNYIGGLSGKKRIEPNAFEGRHSAEIKEALERYLREKRASLGAIFSGLGRAGSRATRNGAVLKTIGGAGLGAGLGATELATGMADPNMSREGKGAVIGLNALAGALFANPASRRALFTKRTLTPVNTGGLAPRVVQGRALKPLSILGAGAVTAGLPKTVNLTDATARLGRATQDAWTNHPENLKPITDPAAYGKDLVGDQVEKVLANQTTRDALKAFGSSVGRSATGMLGGGAAGGLLGYGLGRTFLPDDEKLDYKARRNRERLRSLLSLAGGSLGSFGGMYLANKAGAEKRAAPEPSWETLKQRRGLAVAPGEEPSWHVPMGDVPGTLERSRPGLAGYGRHDLGVGTWDEFYPNLRAMTLDPFMRGIQHVDRGGRAAVGDWMERHTRPTAESAPVEHWYNSHLFPGLATPSIGLSAPPATHAGAPAPESGPESSGAPAPASAPSAEAGFHANIEGAFSPLVLAALSPLAGAGIGGLRHGAHGALRGAGAGLGTGAGALGGMALGQHLGGGWGALLGAGLGGWGGHALANRLMGKEPWNERDKEGQDAFTYDEHGRPSLNPEYTAARREAAVQAATRRGYENAAGALARALLISGTYGTAAGALTAPHGHHAEGAGRGLASGLARGIGGTLGGIGGLALGDTFGGTPGMIGGGLAGLGLGMWGGHSLAGSLLGRPSWEHAPRRRHKHSSDGADRPRPEVVSVPLPLEVSRPPLSLLSKTPPGAERISVGEAPAIKEAGLGQLAGQVGRVAAGGLRRLPGAAKFVAGVPAAQPFAPSAGRALLNTGRMLASPRYPGLDRAPGLATMARPLDATRAAAGTALRRAGASTLVGTGALAANGALQGYPNMAGQMIAEQAGGRPEDVPRVQEAARREAPGMYWELAKQQLGLGDQSAMSRMHGAAARSLAVPFLRHDLWGARQRRPTMFSIADTLRSLTPAGALMTAGIHAVGTPQPPPVADVVAQKGREYAPEIMRDPAGSLSSPFVGAYRRVADELPAETSADKLRMYGDQVGALLGKGGMDKPAAGPMDVLARGMSAAGKKAAPSLIRRFGQGVMERAPAVAAGMATGGVTGYSEGGVPGAVAGATLGGTAGGLLKTKGLTPGSRAMRSMAMPVASGLGAYDAGMGLDYMNKEWRGVDSNYRRLFGLGGLGAGAGAGVMSQLGRGGGAVEAGKNLFSRVSKPVGYGLGGTVGVVGATHLGENVSHRMGYAYGAGATEAAHDGARVLAEHYGVKLDPQGKIDWAGTLANQDIVGPLLKNFGNHAWDKMKGYWNQAKDYIKPYLNPGLAALGLPALAALGGQFGGRGSHPDIQQAPRDAMSPLLQQLQPQLAYTPSMPQDQHQLAYTPPGGQQQGSPIAAAPNTPVARNEFRYQTHPEESPMSPLVA